MIQQKSNDFMCLCFAKSCLPIGAFGAEYFGFFPLFPSKQEKNILSLSQIVLLHRIIFEGSVITFQFLSDKIHNYVKKIHLALSSFIY